MLFDQQDRDVVVPPGLYGLSIKSRYVLAGGARYIENGSDSVFVDCVREPVRT